jgi:hypothetical protein
MFFGSRDNMSCKGSWKKYRQSVSIGVCFGSKELLKTRDHDEEHEVEQEKKEDWFPKIQHEP